jgi:hypothetical protein
MPSKRVPRTKVIKSKVVGVTFDNPDGTSRQEIIARHCAAGMELEVRPEPDNPVQEDALGVWVRTHGLLGSKGFQVGYVRSELADEFREMLEDGWQISGHILEVTGGGWGKNFGVNIELHLTPPSSFPATPPSPFPATPPSPFPATVLGGCFTVIVATILFGFFSVVLGTIFVLLVTMFLLRRIIPPLARATVSTTKRLLEKFSALSPPHRIAAVGFIGSIGGIALWTLGYVIGRLSNSYSILRPTGVVAVIVGLGVLSLGIVFSLSEPPNETNE